MHRWTNRGHLPPVTPNYISMMICKICRYLFMLNHPTLLPTCNRMFRITFLQINYSLIHHILKSKKLYCNHGILKFTPGNTTLIYLTHWGRVTHICVSELAVIASDNGLSPGWHQAIIWTSAGILLIGPSGTNFIEIFIGIQTFSFKKMHWKMASAKWRPFCLGLNVLTHYPTSVVCD